MGRSVVRGFDGILSATIVAPYAYAVPGVEAALGTALRGQHDVLAEQLGYELTYFVLLATASWHRRSVAALIQCVRTTASKRG